jgi:hypothetical protein
MKIPPSLVMARMNVVFPAAVGLTALILQPYFAGGKYLM